MAHMGFQELARAALTQRPTPADRITLARGALLVALSLVEETPPKIATAKAVAGEAIAHLNHLIGKGD